MLNEKKKNVDNFIEILYSTLMKTIAQTFTQKQESCTENMQQEFLTIRTMIRKKEAVKWEQMNILGNPETFLRTDSV